jgi:uncharacterized membrane protein YoaK (UPF0700 family)
VSTTATPTGALHYLLLLLTVVAGAVDAVSFLSLGHVFVVNMTGNLVFLGFAAAGVTEISLTSTLVALLAFMAGSVLGGRLALRFVGARLLSVATAVKVVWVAAALGVVLASHGELDALRRDIVIALLAFAMGLQNASARKIGIPDLTTTVFTMTLTALASESTLAGGTNPRWRWRTLAISAMLVGAFAGGLCVLHAGIAVALGLVIALLAVTGVLAHFAFLAPASAGGSART